VDIEKTPKSKSKVFVKITKDLTVVKEEESLNNFDASEIDGSEEQTRNH